jgi:rhomboid family GlyGly-CTERM serine protease
MPCASLLLCAAAAFVFFLPSVAARLEYERGAIAAGEIWRLLSGHWSHYSLDHFFWDVMAFGFLGIACERRSCSRFLTCVIASAFAISLSVWFCLPGMAAYRGLSGVDSALFALLFVWLCRDAVRSGKREQVAIAAACFAGFLFKISFELVTGNNLFAKSLGSGTVGVPLAHIVGASVGFLVGLGKQPQRARRNWRRWGPIDYWKSCADRPLGLGVYSAPR